MKVVELLSRPKYFDKLFDIDCPSEMQELKERRLTVAEMNKINKLKQYSAMTYEDVLQAQEDSLNQRLGHVKERKLLK